MDFLALFIAASLIGAGLVAWVIIWTTNRAAHGAVTRYFKASEYILETGAPPPEWLRDPAWKRLLRASASARGKAAQLERLDDLILFFERCQFYEDDFARAEHLAQLERVRQSWRDGGAG
ncbi:MAG: hypothetical protein OXG85_06805 [Chloroflexi bacterium]|nr:hypothetical protein [Chloroflexota bacterium]